MINFNKSSTFNLVPIDQRSIRKEVHQLLIDGEYIIGSFKTIRDQFIFTNKRIIAIDVQGISGKRVSFSFLPYTKVQYFAIQTPGLVELFPDSELFLMFANNFTATFEFKANVNIVEIGRIISQYVIG